MSKTVRDDPQAALRDLIRDGRAVIVAGTGVSMAASSHPQASWTGLLEHGFAWLKDHKHIDEQDAEAQLRLLKRNPQTHRFISAAQDVMVGMGGKQSTHFKQWLEATVGGIKAKDRAVLVALNAIREQGHLLATTNYDGLLLGEPPKLSAITWQESDKIIGAAREWNTDKIIFLHGYWRKPESVILNWTSYEQIARDAEYRDDLAAFWKTNTWVYVGCGVSGLSDPDFGLLLERYGERARQAGHWDYCLVCGETQRHEFQAHFDTLKLNLLAVSYGESRADLAGYLHSLLPLPVAPANPPPSAAPSTVPISTVQTIPHPPAFYAKPDYIGRHDFVGRTAQLQVLTDWAKPTDATSILLFEAIGGNGKSMLTWEWTTKHAEEARAGHEPWAGRFWYSFYEKGAIMRDFCLHALHYMTQQPMETLEKKPMADLRTALLAQLHARPWLLILDGLERVLVAYHRIDAAEVRDEEVNRPTDKILDRDPCDAIRDEDTELLRALAAAKPSKILVSSRLIPRVLLNPSGLPLPGVKPLVLPGLDEADAEALLRSCCVKGTSADIRYYLRAFCDNHPLVIGVLAGLINSPGPHRGKFDAWAADPEYGAKLNLASLDLIQSRNHILRAALDALEPPGRQLLSTLALLSDAVDYKTVAAFNPHIPPEPKKLGETIEDLENRGLLQYDGRRYDLHPVVRGVAAGGMEAEDRKRYGQRVVDHYSSQPHNPYEQAKTMEDLDNGLHIVRTLLKLGHYQEAVDAYRGGFSNGLLFNLEAHMETLSLLRPFFSAGWGALPTNVDASSASYLANQAALALSRGGELQIAFGALGAGLRGDLTAENWSEVSVRISNVSRNLFSQNLLAKAVRLNALALSLATLQKDDGNIFGGRLFLFAAQVRVGEWQAAAATWLLLDSMGRIWDRNVYRQGRAEYCYARFQFWRGALHEGLLTVAATLAEQDNNRITLRDLHSLCGAWRLGQGEWAMAATNFEHAVTLARERRLVDAESETGLALAKHHLGQLTGDAARNEAERLAQLRQPAHRTLAQLWLALGDTEKAKHHALAAYRWAWADGEPYVNRYELTKTTELFQQMNVPVPVLPPYDPAKDEPFPWESDVRAAIEKLKAAKEAKKRQKESE